MLNFEKRENLKIEILDAAPEDARKIIAVQKEIWLATYPNEEYGITIEDINSIDWEDSNRIARWQKNIVENTETNKIWVAKEGDKIVGFCSAIKGKERNRVATIYVLPEYQKGGIGQNLMQKALEWLGTEKDIIVSTAKYNSGAIDFYRKSGFLEEKEVPHSLCWHFLSGKLIPEIEMTKPRQQNSCKK